MRRSKQQYKDGRLYNGYDYIKQAWVIKGKYTKCGHPEKKPTCYACHHSGEKVKPGRKEAEHLNT